jgi:LacI family transcriptional regulator
MSITEVARRANLSIATVSRVLNGSRRVDAAVAERVRRAARELRYVPLRKRAGKTNHAARAGLKNIALVAIGGVVRDWFSLPVMSSVVARLTQEANAHGLSVMIEELREGRKISALRERGIDAALAFIEAAAGHQIADALARQMPIVNVFGSALTAPAIDYIGPDDGRVGYIAAEYLLSRGCKSLAVLTNAPQWDFTLFRAKGFALAARATGNLPTVFITGGGSQPMDFYGHDLRIRQTLPELVDDLIAARPDGLFVTRDAETVEVYRLLEERGIAANRDILMVSCDNEDVRLSALPRRPVSIDLGAGEIARQALNQLISRARNPDQAPVRILTEPQIQIAPHDVEG